MEKDCKNELTKSVSFANNYFALIDGLVPGLEKYLAKDVQLNWFGQIIKGKSKVAMFLKNDKLATRHVFTQIVPTTCIDIKAPNIPQNEEHDKETNNNKSQNFETDDDQLQPENTTNCGCSTSAPEMSKSELMNEEKASQRELNEDDLTALSKLDISACNVVQMDENGANEIKQGEVTSVATNMKMECGHEDDPEVTEVKIDSELKYYVEATGEVEFTKKTVGTRNKSTYLNAKHVWKKSCRLQVAYSVVEKQKLGDDSKSTLKTKTPKLRLSESQQASKLPSLDEIRALSSHLVPDTDHFGGYLKGPNFIADRKYFLEKFESELKAKGEVDYSIEYQKNRPILKKTKVDIENEEFLFNYLIHCIVYENNEGDIKNLSNEVKDLKV